MFVAFQHGAADRIIVQEVEEEEEEVGGVLTLGVHRAEHSGTFSEQLTRSKAEHLNTLAGRTC